MDHLSSLWSCLGGMLCNPSPDEVASESVTKTSLRQPGEILEPSSDKPDRLRNRRKLGTQGWLTIPWNHVQAQR